MKHEQKAILVRYGEVWLKSDPVRRQFEQTLCSNIRSVFSPATKVTVVPGRIWIYSDKVPNELARIFGVVSYSPVMICGKNIDEITAAARQITAKWKSGTFAIRARRSDKSFAMTSKELEIALAEQVNLPVDLSNPRHELTVEIRDRAYLFEQTIRGPGGLPLGTAGKVAAQLRDGEDLMAAWLIMKRGALPIFIKPKPVLLKISQKWAIGRKLRMAKSLKEAAKFRAAAVVDTRGKRAKEGDFVVLNPLVGFSSEEKKQLLKTVKSV